MRLIVLYLFISTVCFGQEFPYLFPPVEINNRAMENGFAGGVGSPQFSEIDYNQDGMMDMFVFDRFGARILPFVATLAGPRLIYRFAPEYINNFPRIYDWAIMRDYNADGIQDIFAGSAINSGPFGIEVYTGKSDGTYEIYDPEVGTDNILYWKSTSGRWVNVYVSADDIPAIVDVDGDGDLDVLSFESLGSVMNFYRNVAVEQNLGPDVLRFELGDLCWGKFEESETSKNVTLSNDPNECAVGLVSPNDPENGGMHAGSTTMPFDPDKDGDIDLIIGDLTNDHVVYLENGGTPQDAWITDQDTIFPSYDAPVEMNIFLATFEFDVNQDGIKDLIAAPNETFAEGVNSQWYYIGYEENGLTKYSLEQESLLSGDMIDLGSGCRPTLVDYNADELLDIIVGNDYYYRDGGVKEAHLFLFENVGTPEVPSYKLVDDDYLNLSRFSGKNDESNFSHFAPAFGDLDGDNDMDLVMGTQRGVIFYMENVSGPGQTFSFKDPVVEFMGIDVGENAVPMIYDLNQDGLGDLLFGQKLNQNDATGDACGSIMYFENNGALSNPIFDPDQFSGNNTPCFGNVLFGKFRSLVEGSPTFYEFNGKPRFYFGSNQGIKVIDNIGSDPTMDVEVIDEEFGGFYTDEYFHLALGDINNDGNLEMVVGHRGGGMTIHKTDHRLDGSVNTQNTFKSNIELRINPVDEIVLFKNAIGEQYVVHHITGQQLARGTYDHGINSSGWKQGLYVITFYDQDGSTVSFKVVKGGF